MKSKVYFYFSALSKMCSKTNICLLFWNTQGSDWAMSLDGHDKMCGYQNSTFPLSIYGGQDTYSGRINFLKIWTSNKNPKIIGKFYLEYLVKSKGIKTNKQQMNKTNSDFWVMF